MKALVITDLDGTLLDHHSYDWRPAQPALAALAAAGIPVVFNTSKTYAESQALQAQMGVSAPLIVENGSCVHLADGARIVLGRSRAELCALLEAQGCAARYRYQSFRALGEAGVQAQTGLSAEQARLAATRAWSEPLLWQDAPERIAALRAELAPLGCNVLVGGRFVHVLGDCDKGRAAQALRERLAPQATLVALGDRPNDVAMLAAADIAIWVPNAQAGPEAGEAGGWQRPAQPAHARTAPAAGPAGWGRAILQLLHDGELRAA